MEDGIDSSLIGLLLLWVTRTSGPNDMKTHISVVLSHILLAFQLRT